MASEFCKLRHPLKRQGTSQANRFPVGLKEDFVKLDERSIEDLVSQLAKLSEYLNYYDENHLPPFVNGDWSNFIKQIYSFSGSQIGVLVNAINTYENSGKTPPHLALLLSFLKLFQFAQNELNNVTNRHLRFYYEDFLRIKRKEQKPDRVPVFFELNKNIEKALVRAGTEFKAGKDNHGKEIVYRSLDNLVVNTGVVSKIRSLFVDKGNYGAINGLYYTLESRTDDGVKKQFTPPRNSFHMFGSKVLPDTSLPPLKYLPATVVSSPVLNLPEGDRYINIVLASIIAGDIPSTHNYNLNSAFSISYTGPKGWVNVPAGNVKFNGNQRSIAIQLMAGLPGVIPYNEEVHKLNINTKHPALQIKINDAVFLKVVSDFTLTGAKIETKVIGAKNIVLQNDNGILDNAKPFLPFGSQPVKDFSSLYVGYPAAFNKYLIKFSFQFLFKSFPLNIFEYYNAYGFDFYIRFLGLRLNDFLADIYSPPGNILALCGSVYALDNGKWNLVHKNVESSSTNPNIILQSATGIDISLNTVGFTQLDPIATANKFIYYPNSIQNSTSPSFSSNVDYSQDGTYTPTTKSGSVKVVLGWNFGHAEFSKLFAEAALLKATSIKTVPADPPAGGTITAPNSTQVLPNAPYTPEIQEIYLNYYAETEIAEDTENHCFHIHPYGHEQVDPVDATIYNGQVPFMPQFYNEGNLYIGIDGIKSIAEISLHFQLDEGSGNPTVSLEGITPEWSYLDSNQFRFFTLQQLRDSTLGLTRSGIIKFKIPETAIGYNSVFSDNLVWLKCAVNTASAGFSRVINIRAQAVETEFVDNDNDPERLTEALLPNSVKGPVIAIDGIKKVMQPIESYGGRKKENDEEFFTWVSERLRHKNRAWDTFDYERIVLNKFPDVERVKCVTHSNIYTEYAPGSVLMLAMPNLKFAKFQNVLKPLVSVGKLAEIRQLVSKHTSPFVHFHVINPFYETLMVDCSVKFTDDIFDTAYYKTVLVERIKSFLAPWSKDLEISKLFFGTKLYKSQVIDFIEEVEFVDFITEFKVVKTDRYGQQHIAGEEITTTDESCILTSADEHKILVIDAC